MPPGTRTTINNLPRRFERPKIEGSVPSNIDMYYFHMGEEAEYDFEFDHANFFISELWPHDGARGWEALRRLYIADNQTPTFLIPANTLESDELIMKIEDDLEADIAARVRVQHPDAERMSKEYEEAISQSFTELHGRKMQDIMKNLHEAYARDVLTFLVAREEARLHSYSTKPQPESSTPESQAPEAPKAQEQPTQPEPPKKEAPKTNPPANEEPWSDVWIRWERAEGMPHFIKESEEMIERWISNAERFHNMESKKPHKNFDELRKNALALRTFMETKYTTFLRHAVEVQWVEHVQDRISEHLPIDQPALLAGIMTWSSRSKESKPGFHEKLKTPVNVALKDFLLQSSFGRGIESSTNLRDIFENSLTDKVERSDTSDSRTTKELNSFRHETLKNMANAYYINNTIANQQPMTDEALRALSRCYCSVGDNTPALFPFRPVPEINFMVVECNHGSPLPGQLSVLLTSDPRGLSLAFQLENLIRENRLNLAAVGTAGHDTSKSIQQTLGLMCQIAIFLKEDNRFTLLRRRASTLTTKPTLATSLAGVWRAGKILKTLDDATHNTLPMRPRLSEIMEDFKRGKKETGPDDSSGDEKEDQWMSIDILSAEQTNVVSHVNFKRFRKGLREAVPDFVAENRRIKGRALEEAVQEIDEKTRKNLVTVTMQLEQIIKELARNNEYKIVCLSRVAGLTLKVHKVFDFRVDVERLTELRTAYYLIDEDGLLALYARRTKVESISWQEALALQARYNDFNNALRKQITALIALISEIETVVQNTGVEMKKKELEWEVNDTEMKFQVSSYPDKSCWTLRMATQLKPVGAFVKEWRNYNLLALEIYTVNLLQFHALLSQCVYPAVDFFYKAIHVFVKRLATFSAMCTLDFYHYSNFVRCYKTLRIALRQNFDKEFHSQAHLARINHSSVFELRLRLAQAEAVMDTVQKEKEEMQRMVSYMASKFSTSQFKLMYQVINRDEDARCFVVVGCDRRVSKFARVFRQRITSTTTEYFDTNANEACELNPATRKWKRFPLTFPFTRDKKISIAFETDIYTQITDEMKDLQRTVNSYQNDPHMKRSLEHAKEDLRLRTLWMEDYFNDYVLSWDGTGFRTSAGLRAEEELRFAQSKLEEFERTYPEKIKLLGDELLQYNDPDQAVITHNATERKRLADERQELMNRLKYLTQRTEMNKSSTSQYHLKRKGDGYEWLCPENGKRYTIDEKDLEDYTLDRFSTENYMTSGWKLAVDFPVYNDRTKNFVYAGNMKDIWYCPLSLEHCFQDYNRIVYAYSTLRKKWYPSESKYAIQVNLMTKWKDAKMYIEDGVGISSNDFYVHNLLPNDMLNFVLLAGGPRDIRVCNVVITASKASAWKSDRLEKNQNAVSNRSTKGEWKRGVESGANGEAEQPEEQPTDSTEYLLPNGCSFEALRFLGIACGYPGFIAIDFGTNGEAESLFCEGPYTEFRQSFILYSGTPIVIQRKILHQHYCPFPDRLTTNPLGLNSRNIEQYWGCNRRISELTCNVERKRIIELYGNRIRAFYRWIVNPRNWYWDKEFSRLYVFAFTPDMVKCKDKWVQQMAAYRVDLFINPTQEYRNGYSSFLGERNKALEAWNDLEKKVQPTQEVYDGGDAALRKFYEARMGQKNQEAFKKYYTNIAAYFLNAGAPTFVQKRVTMALPEIKSKEDVLKMMDEQQLATRRLFWRVFKDKFGQDYKEFLVNPTFRREVSKWSPEAFGPRLIYQATMPDAEKFYEQWAEQKDAKEFADFFKGYPFTTSDGLLHPFLWNDSRPSPTDQIPLHEEMYEDWYLSMAEISFTHCAPEDELKHFQGIAKEETRAHPADDDIDPFQTRSRRDNEADTDSDDGVYRHSSSDEELHVRGHRGPLTHESKREEQRRRIEEVSERVINESVIQALRRQAAEYKPPDPEPEPQETQIENEIRQYRNILANNRFAALTEEGMDALVEGESDTSSEYESSAGSYIDEEQAAREKQARMEALRNMSAPERQRELEKSKTKAAKRPQVSRKDRRQQSSRQKRGGR